MKFAWTSLKGVGLLLLGLATAGGGRSIAADVNTQSFAKLAESSSATAGTATAGTAIASPFKDESASTPVKSVPTTPAAGTYAPSGAAGGACNCDCFSGAPGRVWFRGEFLYWQTSGAHLPPVVSTVTDLTNPVGSLATVFGDRDVRNGGHDGYRMDLGMWLDNCHCWGVEGDYFDVTGKADGFDSGLSNGFANGVPFPIVRAFFDPGLDANGNVIGTTLSGVGYPSQFVGRVTVDTSDYFQSAGIWLRHQLRASEWSTRGGDVNWTDPSARTFRLDAIGGYRFARLIDTVNIQDSEMDINSASPTFLTQFTFADGYRTVNNFNGGELGLNAVFTRGRWSLDVVGKAAIGVNNQYVRLDGFAMSDASNAGGGVQQSVSVQEYSRNQFSAIPELTVTAGYQATDNLKFTVGYDLLYWTAVVRAADQIATEPTTGLPFGSLVGSTLPPFSFNQSHFMGQGLRLGAECRF